MFVREANAISQLRDEVSLLFIAMISNMLYIHVIADGAGKIPCHLFCYSDNLSFASNLVRRSAPALNYAFAN